MDPSPVPNTLLDANASSPSHAFSSNYTMHEDPYQNPFGTFDTPLAPFPPRSPNSLFSSDASMNHHMHHPPFATFSPNMTIPDENKVHMDRPIRRFHSDEEVLSVTLTLINNTSDPNVPKFRWSGNIHSHIQVLNPEMVARIRATSNYVSLDHHNPS